MPELLIIRLFGALAAARPTATGRWLATIAILLSVIALAVLPTRGQAAAHSNLPPASAYVTVKGVVYTAHGLPAKRITVALWSDSLTVTNLTTKTDSRGNFYFAVAPDSISFFSSIEAFRRPPTREDRYAKDAFADLMPGSTQPYLLRLKRHRIPRFR